MPDKEPIATINPPSSTSYARAMIVGPSDYGNFLFRLVVYGDETFRFLGIVEDVTIPEGNQRELKIKNLLSMGPGGKVSDVRSAPLPSRVYFATKEDLESFFPCLPFPKRGYIGFVRETQFPLPLDLEKLCFGNTAILAGIGHGKSNLAALIVAQLYLTGKKVLVIDPTGEWVTLVTRLQELLSKNSNTKLSVSSTVVEKVEYNRGPSNKSNAAWAERKTMFDVFQRGDLTVLDISFAKRIDMNAKAKLLARCKIVENVHETLMRVALKQYAENKLPYGYQTCIVLEEAHQFMPPVAVLKAHERLNMIFSISTKEYRKYGLGHIFIDQSLRAISGDIQIQTFMLGSTTTPSDLKFLKIQLGEDVASAAQRTAGRHSWAAIGAATPMTGIAWEIDTFNPGDFSFLSQPTK